MKFTKNLLNLSVMAVLLFASTAGGQTDRLAQKKGLTLAVAKQIAAAASKEACKTKCGSVVVIVDEGGHLIYLEKMDAAQIASVDNAIAKARSAVIYKRTTKSFEDRLAKGDTKVLSLPDAIAVTGGVPLETGGFVIGAIGVSGGGDDEVAAAGVSAFSKIAGQ